MLKGVLSTGFCQRNEVQTQNLADLCTMGIGGQATVIHLHEADDIAHLRDHDCRMLGKGANLLINDSNDGAFTEHIIKLGSAFSHFEIEQASASASVARVRVGAAYDLARCIAKCVNAGLAGPEGLAGVPASIGGALFMNAGTSSCWLFDWVSRVQVLLPDEQSPRWLLADEVPAVYRSSGLPAGTIFLQCEMELQAADSSTLKTTASALKQAKAASQPLAAQSAGCIFKNPVDENGKKHISAGQIIDEIGLKSSSVGAVMVSDIHGNFIVNTGTGRAQDVYTLIQRIRQRAWQERGIALDLEVQCWHAPTELYQSVQELF